jgi:hypothetical protein
VEEPPAKTETIRFRGRRKSDHTTGSGGVIDVTELICE